jgi:hypothetical protein
MGESGNVDGWGAMLQVARSRFLFPLSLFYFSIDVILQAALLSGEGGQLNL